MSQNTLDLSRFGRRSLSNGATLVCETDPTRRSVAVGVYVDAGSRDEAEGAVGIAHFVEHMVFKGTRRRSAQEIAAGLERLGGSLEAFTTKDVTCYYARVLEEHLEPAVDVLCDLISEPLFREEDAEKERSVIAEELRSLGDNPDEHIADLTMAALWPKHPLGRQILGSEDSLAGMTGGTLREFHGRHYQGSSLVVCAAGAVTPDQLESLAQGKLKPPPAPAVGLERGKRLRPQGAAGSRYVLERDGSQLYLSLAAETGGKDHPLRRAVQLLAEILGGGMSSRLFQTIREDLGLAYSVYAYTEHFEDTGIIGSILAVAAENGQIAYERTLEELGRFRRDGLQPGELDAAKAQVRGAAIMGQESLSNRMFRLGRIELEEHRVVPIEESLALFDRVTDDQIMQAAEAVLDPARLCFVALGPADPADWDAVPVEGALE